MYLPNSAALFLSKDEFDFSEFLTPKTIHWPGYMWVWNDRLDIEEIKCQIKDMADHKALSPMVVPEPKAFRPKNMPTRLAPEYLSPEFLNIYKEMVDHAAQFGMRVWLYDEGGWPSGNVCGELVKQNPQLVQQKLKRKSKWVWK